MNALWTLGLGWLTLYLMGTDVFIISPLLPLIAKHFAITPAQAGWGMSVFALAYAGFAPVFGWMGDRWGRRRPILWGLVAFGLANAGSAWSPTFAWFLITRFIAGAAAGAITPTVYAITSDMAPASKRGAWLSIVGSGIFTALWSSAPIGSFIGYRYGWTWPFLLLAGVSVALVVLNKILFPHQTPTAVVTNGGYGRLFADVSLTTIWSVALYATYTYLGTGLVQSDYSPATISAAIAVYGIGMVTGVLSGGRWADRWGAERLVSISFVLVALSALASHFVFLHLGSMMTALFLFSFSAALYFPAFQTYLANHHAHRRGAALAWNNSALYIGITIGSVLGGGVLSHRGFLAIPIVSSLAALLGLAMVLLRPKR